MRPSAHVTSELSGAKPLNPKRNNAECEAKAERSWAVLISQPKNTDG
jgi:hypothetical protein